jgi:hypothetical protein
MGRHPSPGPKHRVTAAPDPLRGLLDRVERSRPRDLPRILGILAVYYRAMIYILYNSRMLDLAARRATAATEPWRRSMRVVGAILGAVALSTLVMVGTAPVSHATTYGFELNGTYSFLSNGEWAKSNDSYHNEPVVRATWKISSACSSTADCTGQVTSDQGWTASLEYRDSTWRVKRELANWAPCETGGAATGHQLFLFYGVDDTGLETGSVDLLAGSDSTTTDSGSCGKSLPLKIVIPIRLQRIN